MEVDGLTRAQRKYAKRKQKQQEKKLLKKHEPEKRDELQKEASQPQKEDLIVEYVPVDPLADIDESDPNYAEFADILRRYNRISQGQPPEEPVDEPMQSGADQNGTEAPSDATAEASESEPMVPKKLSKRQRRLASRMDVADLKKAAKRPDLVDIEDTTAKDPLLLVQLKAYRNTVMVPRHWSQKRKYLQGKRGMEKIPYQLPDFIRNTGITELRQAALERAEQQKLKAKQRERLRPKMGQLDVDYHVLYDAFFRYQTKPPLSRHGELYYEGKEFEPKTGDFVAGVLSENLQKALGMKEGHPPPWLIQMQQHGPPPSYPGLRVPGVNAPIPIGAKYGFHPGGWGRAPIDINGRPIWGWADARDVQVIASDGINDYPPDFKWGAMLYAEDYADLEEEEQEEAKEAAEAGMHLDRHAPGTAAEMAVDGYQESKSIEIDDAMMRTRKFQEIPEQPRELYQVLPQQAASVGSAAMGSAYTYAVPPTASTSQAGGAKRTIGFLGSGGLKAGELEITLDPSDFELSEEQLRQKYERLFREHERQQLQPKGAQQLSDADRAELMRKSLPSSSSSKGSKDKKGKEVKF